MPYFAAPLRPQYEQPSHNYLVPFLDALLASQAEAQQSAQQQQQQQKSQQSAKMHGAKSPSPQQQSRPTPTPRQPNRSNRAFTPRFDIYETDDLYQLDGDLPGVSDKKSINIEFSDIRTLLVTGKVERTVPKPVAAAPQPHDEETDTATKRRSLNPTVEDTDDEDDMSIISHHSEKKTEVVPAHTEEQQQPQEPPRKVWLQERTFGTFQRAFTFPAPVDPQGVTAKLENGLLQITVPKAKVQGVRKIEIQ